MLVAPQPKAGDRYRAQTTIGPRRRRIRQFTAAMETRGQPNGFSRTLILRVAAGWTYFTRASLLPHIEKYLLTSIIIHLGRHGWHYKPLYCKQRYWTFGFSDWNGHDWWRVGFGWEGGVWRVLLCQVWNTRYRLAATTERGSRLWRRSQTRCFWGKWGYFERYNIPRWWQYYEQYCRCLESFSGW